LSSILPVFCCYMWINHSTTNQGKVLDIIQFEIMPPHFMDPPQHLWENTRNILLENSIQPFTSNRSVQDNQISLKSCIYSFLTLCRENLYAYNSRGLASWTVESQLQLFIKKGRHNDIYIWWQCSSETRPDSILYSN